MTICRVMSVALLVLTICPVDSRVLLVLTIWLADSMVARYLHFLNVEESRMGRRQRFRLLHFKHTVIFLRFVLSKKGIGRETSEHFAISPFPEATFILLRSIVRYLEDDVRTPSLFSRMRRPQGPRPARPEAHTRTVPPISRKKKGPNPPHSNRTIATTD